MKASLQLRMSQHLALTPQLQQSIRLLQLSTLELQQELDQILADNPMLERMDDPLSSAASIASDGSLYSTRATTNASDQDDTKPGSSESQDDERDASMPDSSEQDSFGLNLDYGRPGSEDDDEARPQLGQQQLSLRQHLLQQMGQEKLGLREGSLIALLIESLDEDGYLHITEQELDELATSAGLDPVELAEWDEARELLQSFDPPGVAARSISECLGLQLQADTELIREVDSEVLACARIVCAQGLQLLAQRDFPRLKKMTGANDEILRQAQILIKKLNPYPGTAFLAVDTNYVIPDVIVRRIKNEWCAALNPEVVPRLRINEFYAQAVKSMKNHGSTKNSEVILENSLSSRLQEARWLIKNVQQRFDTILRVAQSIVERQRAFFSHGEVAMRPLVLREIADILGLHESTVSRVTTQKYMLTPFGTFEFKYFFGSHVATEAGGAASSTAIRALIKQLIGAENPKKPLSDSHLADMLGEQGIVVARRTVAKYREALRIPPVNQRKTL
ncbi:MAG: RNA polymerase factor sigma-54 [Burkholderiales bacterium]|jgi:RNA polymerase sigma-54 factor|nr:RNA polymerase factor sigma-54 [Burkholderiales bacterium]MCA3161613.1 RNA polymerase factor sigma-54 [Burkholderiales bacterium]MCA3163860.1 RNA polymerase factor sigma-54 [Burkholderiales bacterium]MCA3165712.1 RNA polymerase factor sigma-54 [Burkholderiales bacterium]MCA3169944.1 RNA polymerase factor sigma-54 [Burkholderiales bacterium]